ncbi:MAG: 2-C-methyl-D-erythritol 4-phosphate cytidylyltransferase [Acidobacteria bacterium]|nr:2-C-methyl-D-erythritol 4-phosphate cytidylyltransferase [Acidobacteriota bacterium]
MAVLALIPAAGFGTRFHDSGPKALVQLMGKPLLLHSIERLFASGRVDRFVVAHPAGHREAFEAALVDAPAPILLVEGGLTRRASVAAAARAAGAGPEDLLLVHDAARPLVDPVEVAAVVDAAEASGAALAAFSMIETVKRVSEGRVAETVPRSDLVAASTPQVVRASILLPALERELAREATDDVELVEKDVPVSVVLTSRWNLKITYPEDLVWAEAFLTRVTG